MDFHKAIIQSCDIFFYTMGMRLGIDKLGVLREWTWASGRRPELTSRAKSRA